MSEGAFLLTPNGLFRIEGQRGTIPPCPEAKFAENDVVKVRRLKHLRHLPVLGAVVAVVPPGFSPDWAWADLCNRPRPLLCQVPEKSVTYIVAFENDNTPHLLRESYLLPTNEPKAEVSFAASTKDNKP